MTTSAQTFIAKKYAQAFLNVFGDELSLDTITQVCSVGDLLTRNHTLLFFLAWPIINLKVKLRALHDILQKFSLGMPFEKLIDLLAEQKKLHIINTVLQQICSIYMIRKKIVPFTITSSHELQETELAIIKQFLTKATSSHVIYDYSVDKKLIAGIRAQSDTFLWENSIDRQLAMMKIPLIRKSI